MAFLKRWSTALGGVTRLVTRLVTLWGLLVLMLSRRIT
jgi:hypothetical protein